MKCYYLYVGGYPIKIYKTRKSALNRAKKINKSHGFKFFKLKTFLLNDFFVEPLKIENFIVDDGEIFYE